MERKPNKGVKIMSDYSWRNGDDLSRSLIPKESLPKRVALTATGVVIKRQVDATTGIMLCNPHPDSWNSWMLPYGSLALELEALEENITFDRLGALMDNLRKQHLDDYEAKALAQVRKLSGLPQARFDFEPKLSNFSLKFSKTANVWTAYCFVYHLCYAGQEAKPEVQTIWLSLKDDDITVVVASEKIEGLAVADNVLSLFKDSEALILIR